MTVFYLRYVIMKTLKLLFVAGLATFFYTAAAAQNVLAMQVNNTGAKSEPVFKYEPDFEYALQKGDKININVWDNNDLSMASIRGIYKLDDVNGKWLMLDEEGNVNIPKLGVLNLSGLTINEARTKIRTSFRKYVGKPVVELKVLNHQYDWKQNVADRGEYAMLNALEVREIVYYAQNNIAQH